MHETPQILTVLLALLPAVQGQSAPQPPAPEPRHAPEAPVPDLDYGLRTADLAVVARVASDANGSKRFVVRETLAGRPATGPLPVADFRGLVVHFRPEENGEHLYFLKKLATGYYPVQKAGLMLPWKKETAGTVSRLLPLLQELEETRVARKDGKIEQPAELPVLRALVRFVSSAAPEKPDFAAAALMALARRPDLAPELLIAERAALRTLVLDPERMRTLRGAAARCLIGARDSGASKLLLELLMRGEARKLEPLFGRLLLHDLGQETVPVLISGVGRAEASGKLQLLRALHATRLRAARSYLRDVQKDPKLGPVLKRALLRELDR